MVGTYLGNLIWSSFVGHCHLVQTLRKTQMACRRWVRLLSFSGANVESRYPHPHLVRTGRVSVAMLREITLKRNTDPRDQSGRAAVFAITMRVRR